MPQGRRKTPFSGKQKKTQMMEKRERKKAVGQTLRAALDDNSSEEQLIGARVGTLVVNAQYCQPSSSNVNRYALKFQTESKEELEQKKQEARLPLPPIDVKKLEVVSEDIFVALELGLPKRPPWSPMMSKAELEMREQRYFREYIASLEEAHGSLSGLGYFELNLETWRQLWRVIEMSDIILLVADIRHPLFHFPPGLYEYVVNELHKHMILVLNKVDLVDPPLVVAWISHLKKTFPKLHVVPFASYAGMKYKQSGKNKGRRIGKLRMAHRCAQALLVECESIVANQVDLSSWREKIESEFKESSEKDVNDEEDGDDDDDDVVAEEENIEKQDLSYYESKSFHEGVLTIGTVGHPNVGKSSLLNALMGKKVVSVSRTPGHTKHFQTIFLTETVKLCDCPGLVFPSRAPREMQVLMGCFPIAQLRQPYTAIAYIAERIDVPRILRLTHPEHSKEWSAFDICEAWASARGFLTARTGRPDVYRAANHLLRMALDGRTLCLAFHPPNYSMEKHVWFAHSDVKMIKMLTAWNSQSKDIDYNSYLASFDSQHKGDVKSEESSEDSESESESDDSDGEIDQISNKFALLNEIE